jgi:hypothetical protein
MGRNPLPKFPNPQFSTGKWLDKPVILISVTVLCSHCTYFPHAGTSVCSSLARTISLSILNTLSDSPVLCLFLEVLHSLLSNFI